VIEKLGGRRRAHTLGPERGVRFLDGPRGIRANTIRELRGRGLMLAVELHPEAGDARRYCSRLGLVDRDVGLFRALA
jgi:acetylornithine/succinyldiaminopimelate/putrescine aminotransferase